MTDHRSRSTRGSPQRHTACSTARSRWPARSPRSGSATSAPTSSRSSPRPGSGSATPPAGGARGNRINVSFLSLNRNKRSVAVDLKSAEGKDDALRARRDEPTSSCRTTAPASPRGSASTTRRCSAINPSIVYVSISGYGEDGPYRNRPGQDLLLQAMSGAMLSAGREGAAAAARRAVPRRRDHRLHGVRGRARRAAATASAPARASCVTVNMLDAITTLQMQELSVFTMGRRAAGSQRRAARARLHPLALRRLRDGRRLHRARDARPAAARRGDRRALLRRTSTTRSTAGRSATRSSRRPPRGSPRARTERLARRLSAAGIWAGPVYDYADLVDDEQIAPQRHVRRVRPPHRGAREDPRVPVPASRRRRRASTGAHR